MHNNFNQTRVILVRHGRSTYNEQQRYQGCCDESVLTEKGKYQALKTGLALSKIKFDAVYASPLQRTQETAKDILKVNKYSTKIILNSNLKEVDLPGWQGLQYKYVRQEFAEQYRIWEETPHEFTIENIESNGQTLIKTKTKPVLQLYKKAQQFWQEILPLHRGKTILVVSHGGTIRALLSAATKIKPHNYHAIQQSNSSINILDFANSSFSAKAQISAINLTQHLGEVLPKLKDGKHGLRLLLLPVNPQDNQTDFNNSKIFKFLREVELDFCISDSDITHIKPCVESIIKSRSKPPFSLSISRENFLGIWHQKISQNSRNYNILNTSLVVADINTITTTLSQILGVESQSLKLNQGEISILFYPNTRNHPVLQAMNIVALESL
ncbi:MAG: histidine phosphatase family protein [Cyanobacteria bacterium P01_C01_bin.38]